MPKYGKMKYVFDTNHMGRALCVYASLVCKFSFLFNCICKDFYKMCTYFISKNFNFKYKNGGKMYINESVYIK